MQQQNSIQTEQKLFDVNETARMLGRSAYSVRMLYYNRELPAVKSGRKMWFDGADIEAFIQKNKGYA